VRPRRSLTPFLVVLAPLLLVLGVWLGGHPRNLPDPVRDLLVGDERGQVYDEALETINDNYYRKVDEDELLDKSLGAAVKSLDDRFSTYFDPKQYKAFEEATDGAFEGVGMNVSEVKRGLRVLTVFDDSPAQEGGLEEGDVITAVDGEPIAGKSSAQATTLIKGRAGTDVTLTVVTGKDAPRDLKLERAKVDVPSVESEMRRSGGEKIAHVRLAGFTSGAHGEVRKAVDDLLDQGARGVVLDLRDNGGGLLNEAVLVSSIFIDDGVIVSTDGRSRPKRVFEATGDAIDADIPVAVLVNRNSASASEIVTGALQDRDRAEVIGTRTFGKGVFQEVRRLSNGGALDITVGEYFTPDGRNLGGGGVKQGAGIKPDVATEDDPDTPRDEALDVATQTVAREAR
jgi:carboxyl-terminal processing protease